MKWGIKVKEIFVTSDLHFGQDKPFLYRPRGFTSIQEHDEAIIENWNSVVSPEDHVFILGDLMLGDNEHGMACMRRLNGSKSMVLGNHDTTNRKLLYAEIGEVLGYADIITVGKYRLYLSHYPTITSSWDYEKPLKSRTINLCGHSHTNNKWKDWDKGVIYHCELDAHSCLPIPLVTIIDELKEKFDELFNKVSEK